MRRERLASPLWRTWCLSWLLVTGCDSERDQARALLEHMDAVDIRLDLDARTAAVKKLDTLSLDEAELVRAREACVEAHRALIEAERHQATARADLDRAERGQARLPPEAAGQVVRNIERSQSAYQQAKALFPACERRKRKLSLRFAGKPSE